MADTFSRGRRLFVIIFSRGIDLDFGGGFHIRLKFLRNFSNISPHFATI